MDKALNGMFWSSGSWLLIKISVLHLFLLTFPIKKKGRIWKGIARGRNIPVFTVITHIKKGIYRKNKHFYLCQSWESLLINKLSIYQTAPGALLPTFLED